ncbi:MAG TPA: hypothetical protein VFR94_05225 [Nitrososphaeraceae archaeon]|nr:hypothetical protein [Nitrososphaeraceae archaeon]
MRKGNEAKNSTISSNSLLSVVTMLSILTIVTSSSSSPVSSSLFSLAFASHGAGYNGDLILSDIARGINNNNQVAQEEDDLGLVGNLISQQQSPQADARNVNVDNKVIIEGCEDGEVVINDNDQIIQTNTQSFNQEANNQVAQEEDDLGLVGNLISQQQSPQADARNVNVDNKVIIVQGDCDEIVINDNDQIIQTNTQSFNQEANNQVAQEEEDEEDEG